ncbi:MAG: hypothetical protein WBM36_05660 [Lysobacterales bacterium]
MLDAIALTVVVLTGIYFCAFGTASLFVPAKANRFLLGFASSPSVHYIELFFRLLVGAAFYIYAPRMLAPDAFRLFGWILLITTAFLLLFPWRWHHWFAQQAVPRAIPYIKVIGICSLALSGLILTAVINGNAA